MRLFTIATVALLAMSSSVLADDSGAAEGALAAAQDGPYGRVSRVREIAASLAALRVLDDQKLLNTYRYVQLVERNQCRAPLLSLKIECLMEAARQNCRGRQQDARETCERASDVMITNRVAANVIVSQEDRLDLMKAKGQSSFKDVFEKELRTRYASLVVEMSMSYAADQLTNERLPETIDSYCLKISGTREISWQHCSAALIWFIATSDRENIPGKENR